MPHFRSKTSKSTAKRTAIAALFTAVSAVSGQMSGDLNGSAARFAAHINVLTLFERRFERRRRSFCRSIFTWFKNLAKVRLCRNNIRIFDLKTFFHANIGQCRKFARFTTPFWQKTP